MNRYTYLMFVLVLLAPCRCYRAGLLTDMWSCLVVPEVVSPESGPQLAAPVISSPLKDLLVPQGSPAKIQCTVSGEGTAPLLLFFLTS